MFFTRNLQPKQFWNSRVHFAGSQFVPGLTADRVHCTIVIPESKGGRESCFLRKNFDTKYVVVRKTYR